MALITCPHCGKSVSDSVATCIHCGGSLRDKPVPEKEREFAALPLEEQKNLRNEFEQKYPAVAESDKSIEQQNKKRVILITIMLSIGLVGIIVCFIFSLLDMDTVALVAMGVTVVCTIVFFVFYFRANKYAAQRLTNLKRFQVWLKQEKNVHYSVILKEKDRKIFEQITLD